MLTTSGAVKTAAGNGVGPATVGCVKAGRETLRAERVTPGRIGP